MTVQSPLRASWRWTSQTSPHRLLIHPTVASTSEWWKGKRRMMSCCFSFSFFFFFNWKHRVLPPSPATETLFPLLFLSSLVCWINHFTPVLNKRTKGRLPLPSNYWFTNRQDVYFLTENSIWNILIMLFFFFFWFCFIVSPTLPPSWIFLQEEEDSSETVLISTRHHRHCNKTLEFRKTSRTHTHSYTYNICVTISKGSFSSNFLPVQPLIINQNNRTI